MILHLHENLEVKGGAETHIRLLMKYLPEIGINASWACIQEQDGGWNLQIQGSEAQLQCNNFSDFKKVFIDYLDSNDVELIHIHSVSNKAIVSFALELRPVVRSMHEPRMFCPGHGKFWLNNEETCTQPFGLHCFLHAYVQKCAPRAPGNLMKAWKNSKYEIDVASKQYSSILVTSEYMKGEALIAGFLEEKIEKIPYFADPEYQLPKAVENTELRLLYTGRFIEHKGVEYMLDAISNLKYKDNFHLDIIGGGYLEEKLKSIVKLKDLTKRVSFHSWLNQEEIKQYYVNADLVIFPSIYPEAFGIVGLEAMMASKPVVGFKTGGVPDWLIDGQNGFLVDNKNSLLMAERIDLLMSDKQLRIDMGARGRAMVAKNFNKDHILNQLQLVYQKALN